MDVRRITSKSYAVQIKNRPVSAKYKLYELLKYFINAKIYENVFCKRDCFHLEKI